MMIMMIEKIASYAKSSKYMKVAIAQATPELTTGS